MTGLAQDHKDIVYPPQAWSLSDHDGTKAFAQRLVQPLLTFGVLFFCFHLWRVGDVNVTLSDTMLCW